MSYSFLSNFNQLFEAHLYSKVLWISNLFTLYWISPLEEDPDILAVVCFELLPLKLYFYLKAVSVTENQFLESFISPNREVLFFQLKNFSCCGWGTVAWVSACQPKGRWFDSQSGHMPGLRARSPVGGARGNHSLMFLSLFLPPSL